MIRGAHVRSAQTLGAIHDSARAWVAQHDRGLVEAMRASVGGRHSEPCTQEQRALIAAWVEQMTADRVPHARLIRWRSDTGPMCRTELKGADTAVTWDGDASPSATPKGTGVSLALVV